MATDGKVIADHSTEPTEKLGLAPLGNALVNVLLNRHAFTRAKQDGTELVPVGCGSMTSAAYLFEPAIKVVPNLVEGTTLPDGDVEQEVAYWRKCDDERDLSRHFDPNGVVDAMRPASLNVDRLG